MATLSKVDYCALTTDLWTSRTNLGYMTVTCHFITEEWHPQSAVLSTVNVTEAHTAVNLASALVKVTDEWMITEKVCCMTTDNASNIINAIKLHTQWEHSPCFAHTLNLVVTNSIDNLPDLVSIITKVKNVVSYFHRSTKASDKLRSIQTRLNIADHKLIQHVDTRWNSIYYMLERYLEQQEAIRLTLCLLERPDLDIPSEHGQTITESVAILKPFEAVTREISGEWYITASKIIIFSSALQKLTPTNCTVAGGRLAERLKANLARRFLNIEGNIKLASATLLDPRFKKAAFMKPEAAEQTKTHIVSELADLLEKGMSSDANGTSTSLCETDKESDTTNVVWQSLDKKIARASHNHTPRADAIVQVQQYLRMPNIPRHDDPLSWWKENSIGFPLLQRLAKKYLTMQATSVPSERLFSKAGELISAKRSRIKPLNVNMFLFLNKMDTLY